IDLLRYQVKGTYAWLEMTVSDVSEEQANWKPPPPGVANSIGAVYAHLTVVADFDLNSRLYGRMPVIASEFKGAVGMSDMHRGGFDWHDWAVRLRVDWDALRRYGEAVRRSLENSLDSVTMEELERPVDMSAHGLGTWKGLDIYVLHGVDHPRLHGGEIACLKGLQGASGWTQGWSADRTAAAVLRGGASKEGQA
ncbi:MAG TPA: DinB family protein, partial [Dehalococcoidia bacterium]|nr:DinB family protein [Dehalococcoidia bacterium]